MLCIGLAVALVISVMFCFDVVNRLEVAGNYIHELEQTIEANGTVVSDVCGGDGYDEYYNQN